MPAKIEEHLPRRVCVFCGSHMGHDRRFAEAADEMGRAMVARGVGLVYGGGRVGLMGVLADSVLAAGGEVIGVIPGRLATKELLHEGATRMHIVAGMHARKALMAELSDAFVALPGGYGTLEETFEMITWAQLGIQQKGVGLLDVHGFYRPLVQFIDHAVAAGFIRQHHRDRLVTAESSDPLLDLLFGSSV